MSKYQKPRPPQNARFDNAIAFNSNNHLAGQNSCTDCSQISKLIFPFSGFQMKKIICVDKMLPVGIKISAKPWECFGACKEWHLVGTTYRYLDDMLFLFPNALQGCY